MGDLGTSDGQVYNSWFDYHQAEGNPWQNATNPIQNNEQQASYQNPQKDQFGGMPIQTIRTQKRDLEAEPQTGEFDKFPGAQQYGGSIRQTAQQYGLNPVYAMRQIRQESGFQSLGANAKGAAGIAQFIPETAKRYGVDVTNPESSIQGMGHYMFDLKNQFHGNEGLALAGYNWGESNVQRWLSTGMDPDRLPKETKNYVRSITGRDLTDWAADNPSDTHIVKTHDVPLAAAGIIDNKQNFKGIAVDKDAPNKEIFPGFHPNEGVYIHEKAENEYMKDLVAGGMSEKQAYHKAHDDIANPREKAYVQARAVEAGVDKDEAYKAYQEYWKGVAEKAKEKYKSGKANVHPQAHTTIYGLDESELGIKHE